MAEDPFVTEVGRIADDAGRVLIVGADHGAVTLRTLHTRTDGTVALGPDKQEELGQYLIAAVWQAAWQQQKINADAEAAAAAGAT